MNAVTLLPLAQPVDADVTVPGSKSYTLRALLLAALTPGSVRILNPLVSDDTTAMLACLKTLGIETHQAKDCIEVRGCVGDVLEGHYTLDADLSAASLRFLLALSVILPGTQVLHGKEGLNKRPVSDLVESLRALGAEIDYLEKDGYPPVRVSSSRLKINTVQVSGDVSSQYISALMMIASAAGGLTIDVTGNPVSKPYLDMTTATLEAFGIRTLNRHYRQFSIPPEQHYQCAGYTVEGDASSAAYYMAVAALTHSRITLRNLPAASAQADMKFLGILERMGARVERLADCIIIEGHGVKPLTVNMEDCPDQAQTMAVLAAFAPGVTRIEGLRSLRVKETDRLAAVAKELSKMGLRVNEEADAIEIHGGTPQAAEIETYGDHRMAMAFAVAGAKLPGLAIRNPEVVSKTYPEFWQDFQQLGIGVCREKASEPTDKIVLIGFMGAGKTVLASLLSQKLGLESVEMDTLILQRSGRASVREIFELDGETRFRELEIETARVLRDKRQAIVSTGGGLIMNKLAIDYLSESGTVVYLKANLDTVLARLASDTERPLLQDRPNVRELFDLREPLYRHYAGLEIETDAKTPGAIVEEIIRKVRPAGLSVCESVKSAPKAGQQPIRQENRV
jgi:3-phosphoshikimate 1-carboxyvinyltransferase